MCIRDRYLIGIILFLITTSGFSQKEDFQWMFNSTSIDNCEGSNFYKFCNASVLDFNTDPPSFYQNVEATLDLAWTHASICDSDGQMLLYSNGMSIHGHDHTPIINGDTIRYGIFWDNNTWNNELGEVKPRGFLGTDCAGFIPSPENRNKIFHLYYNFDSTLINGRFKKYVAEINVSDPHLPIVRTKDSLLIETTIPSHTTCAQHGNGRDWWLLQFSTDTLFSFLIDPKGIHLHHLTKLPFSMDDQQTTSVFNDVASKYAVHSIVSSDDPKGNVVTIFDFDRCSGDLFNPIQDSISSLNISATPGSAFSASGQYLYINDRIHCFQYDMWANDIIASKDTVMIYDEIQFDEPITHHTRFGFMRKGPDNKIYLCQAGQGLHVHVIHEPDRPGLLCRPEQKAIKLPTFHIGTLPTHNTLRLGPLDDSPCDTLDLDNHPISRFRYEQDSLDHLAIDFVDLSYFEPTAWSWYFGDGNSSIKRFPEHIYAENGVYRVCQTVSNQFSTDVSCDTLFLGTSSLSDTNTKRHITLFPNPVLDFTRVAFHDYLPEEPHIKVYNSDGQMVLRETLDGVASLVDMSGLTDGVYVYEVWDVKTRIGGGKVVKI